MDLVGDHLGGAVLGIAQRAVADETLLLAGRVVGYAGERPRGEDDLAGADLPLLIRDDAAAAARWTAADVGGDAR